MAIRHSTPADNSFTPLGKIAWDAGHDGDASDLAFVPSGTGAITGTVQGQLRKFVFASDFDTSGHYDTAKALLTGTMAVPKLEVICADNDYPIVFKTSDTTAADFNVTLYNQTFSATNDNVFRIGYNNSPGGARADTNEPAWFWSIESNYNDGAAIRMEMHYEGVHADGTTFRNLSFDIIRATKATTGFLAADTFHIKDRTGANAAISFSSITTTSCTFNINAGTVINKTSNNVGFLYQYNAAASNVVELVRADASDQVLIAPGGATTKMGGTLICNNFTQLGDGAFATPSLTFASDTTSGFLKGNTGQWGWSDQGVGKFVLGGGQIRVDSAYAIGWCSGTVAATLIETQLVRDTTNTLALKNSNSAMTFRNYAGNGGYGAFVSFNESLTIAAAATTDSTLTIPAGAVIHAASVRVTTIIPTAATFTVTTATGGTTLSTAAVAVAAGTTDAGTAAGALYTSAGTKIRITPNLTPGAATGVVRICGYYFLPTPPTS